MTELKAPPHIVWARRQQKDTFKKNQSLTDLVTLVFVE